MLAASSLCASPCVLGVPVYSSICATFSNWGRGLHCFVARYPPVPASQSCLAFLTVEQSYRDVWVANLLEESSLYPKTPAVFQEAFCTSFAAGRCFSPICCPANDTNRRCQKHLHLISERIRNEPVNRMSTSSESGRMRTNLEMGR